MPHEHEPPINLSPTAAALLTPYGATDRCCDAAAQAAPINAGSRRRRLWQLDAAAHCPVLGVCVPIGVLRRLVTRGPSPAVPADDDYRMHCLAVGACKRREPVSEALHKELERRYASFVRQAAVLRSTAELAAWWRDAKDDERMPGALWAALTHARCDSSLEEQVIAEVHMLQHQRGADLRVDRKRFVELQRENVALRRQAEGLLARNQELRCELARQVEEAQSQDMQLRAVAIGRETTIAALRDEVQALQAREPDARSRADLARRAEDLAERVGSLERALLRAQLVAERERKRADEAVARCACLAADRAEGSAAQPVAAPMLGDRAVLCVGGRPASVPLYRLIVEGHGGRFLHHDGGGEQSPQELDATLSAADVVICQTGCISHGAYWRVKDYCKRHGKPCVFVEKPGSAGLKRALLALQS